MGVRGPPKQFAFTKLVKLTAEQIDRIRAHHDAHGLATDSEAIRDLIERGLLAADSEQKKPKARRARP